MPRDNLPPNMKKAIDTMLENLADSMRVPPEWIHYDESSKFDPATYEKLRRMKATRQDDRIDAFAYMREQQRRQDEEMYRYSRQAGSAKDVKWYVTISTEINFKGPWE